MGMCLCRNSCPKWIPDGSAGTAPASPHPLGCPTPAPSGGGQCKPHATQAKDRERGPHGALMFCFLQHLQSSNQNLVSTLLLHPCSGGSREGREGPAFQAPIQRGCQCIRGSGIPIRFHLFMTSWLHLSKIWFFLFKTGLTNRTDLKGL